MLLSIGLMVKNESKHLDTCLQSLMPILNKLDSELIIVDTGSTDNSVEIAQRYTDMVYHHEWFDDFAGMRNIVLSYCSGEWFFYVDGDEVVEDASGIVRFFKTGQHRKYNAAFIDMKNPYSSREIDGYSLFQALRFFRKDDDFHFKGIVHEQPQAKGPVARVGGSIIHYGYISDDPELMEYKFQRNVALIQKVLSEDPDNIHHLYQLSQSYGMYGKYRDALEPIEKAYCLAKKKGLAQYMNVVTQMASVYYQNQMFQQCEAICREGLGTKSGYMDLAYYQAMSQAELGKSRESIPLFKKYLSLVNQYESGQGMIDFTIAHHTVRNKERAFAMLCGIYAKLGDYEKAEEYGTMVTAPELAKHVVPHLVDAYFNQDDYNAIRKLYNKWQHDEGILSTIERAIENKLLVATPQEKQEIARLFADMGNTYGLLNAARYHYLDGRDQVTLDFWRKIAEIDLNRKEVYYGDLILFCMNKGRSLVELLKNVRNENIMAYFSYLFGAYEQLTKEFRTLFNNKTLWETAEGDTQVYRIKTAIIYAFLRQNGVSDNDYEVFFRIYTDVGIKYLEECYNQKILDADSTSWAITSADEFLFLIRKALVFDRNRVEYVQLLRRALVSDPSMKKGIEILINEFSAKLETPEDMEFNRLKKSVQESIQNAINNSQLDVAASLIKEYEDIVGVDASLCAFKGIMHMINGNYEAARDNFLLGLKLEPDNEDLIYNLNYLDDIGQAK